MMFKDSKRQAKRESKQNNLGMSYRLKTTKCTERIITHEPKKTDVLDSEGLIKDYSR